MSSESQTVEFKFALGIDVRDIITGFVGAAVSRTEYLNGCIQYGIRGKVDKDGKVQEVEYIDEAQLVPVNISSGDFPPPPVPPPPREIKEDGPVPGGPQDHPRGMAHPE